MNIDISTDLMNFRTALIIGILMGVLFDIFRALRWNSKPKRTLTYLEDLLFWIIIAIMYFMLLVKTTDGVLRGFVFIGSFIGSTLYYLILSKYFLPILIKTFKLIFEMISEIIKIIGYPFKRIKKGIKRIKIYFKGILKYFKITFKKK